MNNKNYQGEEDAYILLAAEKINSDSSRVNNAKSSIKKMVQQKEMELKATRVAADKLNGKSNSKKVVSPFLGLE